MDFIKRHYEKLLLLLMLVLFIGIMIYVVGIAEKTRKTKDDALTIKTSVLLQEPVLPKSGKEAEFNVDLILEGGKSDWRPSIQREFFTSEAKSVPGTFSDLVEPARIASCPHCKKLIPRYYFRTGFSCPACVKELHDVPLRPKQRRRLVTENDWDGDGMPNNFETTHRLDPRNFDDQLADPDRDGFSNLFEYENGTDPRDPLSRVPLWWRLKFVSNDSVELPVKFKGIETNAAPKDKSKWLLQIEYYETDRYGRIIRDAKGNPRASSLPAFLNDEITFDKKKYKIVEANLKQSQAKAGGSVIDESTIKVVQVLPENSKATPDVLEMKAGVQVRSNDKRLKVEDVGKPLSETADKNGGNGRDVRILRVGDFLRMGATFIGQDRKRVPDYETYVLKRVDDKTKKAFFERTNVKSNENPQKDSRDKLIVVTVESEIPEDVQVKSVKPKAAGAPNVPGSRRR